MEWSRTSYRYHGENCLTSKNECTEMHNVHNLVPTYHTPTSGDHYLCPGDSPDSNKCYQASRSSKQEAESEANVLFLTDTRLVPGALWLLSPIPYNAKGQHHSIAKPEHVSLGCWCFLVYEKLVSQNKPMHLLHKHLGIGQLPDSNTSMPGPLQVRKVILRVDAKAICKGQLVMHL